jgi:hypothetical protein
VGSGNIKLADFGTRFGTRSEEATTIVCIIPPRVPDILRGASAVNSGIVWPSASRSMRGFGSSRLLIAAGGTRDSANGALARRARRRERQLARERPGQGQLAQRSYQLVPPAPHASRPSRCSTHASDHEESPVQTRRKRSRARCRRSTARHAEGVSSGGLRRIGDRAKARGSLTRRPQMPRQ